MPNITTNHAITYTNSIEGKITECWLVNEEDADWSMKRVGQNYSLTIGPQVA